MTPRKRNTEIKNGYEYYKDSGKSVHLQAAIKKYGGNLSSSDVVHHSDSDKLNNHPSNLRKMSRSAHGRLHARQSQNSGWGEILFALGGLIVAGAISYFRNRSKQTYIQKNR